MKRRTRATPEDDDVTITYESTVLKKPKRNVSEESCVSKSKPAECFKSSKAKTSWSIPEVLSQSFQLDITHCEQFTSFIEDDCTLPFIARYRKDAVGNIQIEELRKMKSSIDELKKVQSKVGVVLKALEKQNQLTDSLKDIICGVKDLDELEDWYAPFKDTKKRTLAGRAKEIGLEEPALKVLHSQPISLQSLIDKKVQGLEDIHKVKQGIQHIIAEVIGKDIQNISFMDSLISRSRVSLQVSKARSASKQDPEKVKKFELYFNASFNIDFIKPHQFLAVSRGEDLKILSLKIEFPQNMQSQWNQHCRNRHIVASKVTENTRIIDDSIQDAYNRIVEPLFTRRIRSKLTETAHRASIDTFSDNLKSILLIPPMTNTTVLGLDPGFKHGCKCAVVAPDGTPLHTETIYITFGRPPENQSAAKALKQMVDKFGCYTIALGNGTACRETESFLSQLIQDGFFHPHDLQYTIINEAGASIYSCSPEAKAEFPDLEPNVISAISLGRRLEDPLTEYVRVSPQHLGIGMYQHDISLKRLESSLEDIVTECVSFVGVDLNTCPLHVLSNVAGLTSSKAKKIIEHRTTNGPFINRLQLMEVPTIGPKTFEQCAGFLRILPSTCQSSQRGKKKTGNRSKVSSQEVQPLDRTCVHPESYQLAKRIMSMFNGNSDDIGYQSFIQSLGKFRATHTLKEIAKDLNEPEGKLLQILNSLAQPLQYDMRTKFEKPMFRRGVTSMADLQIGTVVTGQVTNVTAFGAFIDIGVGQDGLLHISEMKKAPGDVCTGASITVRVKTIELVRKRIGLELIN